MVLTHTTFARPTDKIQPGPARRLRGRGRGSRRLVAETPAARPGHRAFVDVRPEKSEPDARAQAVAGSADAADAAELIGVLTAWGVPPSRFGCPWDSDDPR